MGKPVIFHKKSNLSNPAVFLAVVRGERLADVPRFYCILIILRVHLFVNYCSYPVQMQFYEVLRKISNLHSFEHIQICIALKTNELYLDNRILLVYHKRQHKAIGGTNLITFQGLSLRREGSSLPELPRREVRPVCPTIL